MGLVLIGRVAGSFGLAWVWVFGDLRVFGGLLRLWVFGGVFVLLGLDLVCVGRLVCFLLVWGALNLVLVLGAGCVVN